MDRSDERDLREFLLAALAVEAFMMVFFLEAKVYDMSTAAIFAFSFGLLARGKFKAFYVLYPLGCLNRETMPLLSLFFAAYYFWRLEALRYVFGMMYQGSVFLGIRLLITQIFAGRPGQPAYFWPARVLDDYLARPLHLVVLILVAAIILYLVVRSWREKPIFLRSAFVVLLPVLVMLHLTMGMAFEVRVFAEVFPVIWSLMFVKGHGPVR